MRSPVLSSLSVYYLACDIGMLFGRSRYFVSSLSIFFYSLSSGMFYIPQQSEMGIRNKLSFGRDCFVVSIQQIYR